VPVLTTKCVVSSLLYQKMASSPCLELLTCNCYLRACRMWRCSFETTNFYYRLKWFVTYGCISFATFNVFRSVSFEEDDVKYLW